MIFADTRNLASRIKISGHVYFLPQIRWAEILRTTSAWQARRLDALMQGEYDPASLERRITWEIRDVPRTERRWAAQRWCAME